MAYGGMMVFSGSACPKLAESISHYLGQPLGKVVVDRFSDGEVQVEVIDNVRGRDVFIVQSTGAPTDQNLMELLIMVDAMRRASRRASPRSCRTWATRARTGACWARGCRFQPRSWPR